ncbi:MAG: RDD family protein [Gammaproteobacteria bacterium]
MQDHSTAQNTAPFGYLELQTPEALDYRLEIAGIGARSHAFLIDWHIRLLLALTWLLAVGLGLYSLDRMYALLRYERTSIATLLWLAPAALIYFLYHPLLEIVMAGRTPGKRMAGVRLVTLQGRTPGIGALLLRNVFRLLDSLPLFYLVGLISVAVTKQQVRIGDLAAGLVLVYDHPVARKELERVTDLALHSRLDADNQALLLDLLARWNDIEDETRIAFAERFFRRIGMPVVPNSNKSRYSRDLKAQLEALVKSS